MDDNPFDKIHQASTRGHGVTLTHADVMLIMELLGDELGRVEAKLLKWDDIIKEVQPQQETRGRSASGRRLSYVV